MNKADSIKVKEIQVSKNDVLNYVYYDGDTYLQHTVNEGTKTSYLLQGTGDPITVSSDTETQAFGLTNPLVVSLSEFITDNLGNIYGKVYYPSYEVLDVDGSGKATLVGKQPGGRFGKG